ncbi:hypothetical protein SAMN02745945_01565 [Peptoclostridium litorale DSM 5388]|uniref:GrdX protein n=1 Tax=Peptoclostridium litorale DSM 5388 TaxID=1121324 RepID=A0A069RPS0_PEPLI|nr:GrdX family protein [Peptoclostridium litorale]KDR96157.1 hypothetical protein CLIT_5c01690 [Peptoclostridium litorale DSM 5388]SIO03356.1 hypothetical protein SAMN02745945_01565 [Peptoclostridium litorale DSM 5388]
MEGKIIMVTNNPALKQSHYPDVEKIYIEEKGIQNVLCYVRDQIHKGHRLLTHPLSGSLKPNENPYKSILISKNCVQVDFAQLEIVENCIESARKFIEGKRLPDYGQKVMNDFMIVDKTIIESGLKK